MSTTISPSDAGCWLDSARGWTTYPAIIDIACGTYWFELPEDVKTAWASFATDQHDDWLEFWRDRDDMHDVCDMAESYLNTLAPEGYYFGTSEQGDWGLWAIEGDEA